MYFRFNRTKNAKAIYLKAVHSFKNIFQLVGMFSSWNFQCLIQEENRVCFLPPHQRSVNGQHKPEGWDFISPVLGAVSALPLDRSKHHLYSQMGHCQAILLLCCRSLIRQFRHSRGPSGKPQVGKVAHTCNPAQHQGKQEFEVIWATRETWSPTRKSGKLNNNHKTPNPKPIKSNQKKFLKVEGKQEEDKKRAMLAP